MLNMNKLRVKYIIENIEYSCTSQFIFRFNQAHINWVKIFIGDKDNHR